MMNFLVVVITASAVVPFRGSDSVVVGMVMGVVVVGVGVVGVGVVADLFPASPCVVVLFAATAVVVGGVVGGTGAAVVGDVVGGLEAEVAEEA